MNDLEFHTPTVIGYAGPEAKELAPATTLVLTCSCLPEPETLLDRPSGSLFVHQGAGLRLDPSARAALCYGLDILHLDEIFVLGHANCPLPDSSCDRPEHVAETVRALCALDDRSVVALSKDGASIEVVGSIALDG